MSRRDLSQLSSVDALVSGCGRGRLAPTWNGFAMGTNDADGG